MSLQAEQLGDLLAATLKDLGEMRITDLTSDLQEYVAFATLLKQNRVVITSGTAIQWDLMTTHSGAAHFNGMYATDVVNVGDTLIQASAPWRHGTTNYAFDEREIDMNGSPRRIVDLLKTRRYDSMISFAEICEQAFWSYPLVTDTLTPWGVCLWVVKNNTVGFNGGAQSGWSNLVAGVDTSIYDRWKNYSGQYTDITDDDLLAKWRDASRLTKFTPPVERGIQTFNTGDKFGYYTNIRVMNALETLGRAQNDDLGAELSAYQGSMVFRRTPVTWVPKLDEDTTDPVYGLNWGVFKTYVLKNWWLREVKINMTPGQHTVATVHVDSTFNWICKDRRRNFVLAKAATYPF